MNKQELKNLIKPLIKECLKEVLVEEGFTKMIAESQQPIQQNKQPAPQYNSNAVKPNLQEARKRMLDEIGMSGFNAFAGTTPITDAGTESNVPVTGLRPNDPGVDISRLLSKKLLVTNNAINGKKDKE